VIACPHCSRANPAGALFCFAVGSPLGSVRADDPGRGRFVAPFVFPCGRAAWTFDELARGCLADWPAAVELLQTGALAAFLGGLGRHDLAQRARSAALFPDGEWALADFLEELPTHGLPTPRLAVSPSALDAGRLRVGIDHRLELHLVNEGDGFLHGSVASSVPWIAVGEEGAWRKFFGCLNERMLPIRIRGSALRAGPQPQEGRLVIESSGGLAAVTVKVEVPPVTFAAGVLAGARTPRQLVERAQANPQEAARLFDSGAVARWYRDNGWTYPVEGEPAKGLAAVQQFFDALGLAGAPPRLVLNESSLQLDGEPGQTVHARLNLSTPERRPVYARAVSDQPWLVVAGVDLDGPRADIRLEVPAVPNRPGQTLQASLTIVGNARQRFVVPVTLAVTVPGAVPPPVAWLPASAPLPPPPVRAEAAAGQDWAPITRPVNLPGPAAAAGPPIASSSILVPIGRRRSALPWLLLLPLILLALAVIGGLGLALSLPGGSSPKKESDNQATEAGSAGAAASRSSSTREGEAPAEPFAGGQPDAPALSVPSGHSEVRPSVARGLPAPPPLAVREFTTREVEVVFCLDTTGSMGGLIRAAQSKIWSMCNQIAGGKPVPSLKVGLVAYRDKGDEYITKVTDLSRDLDSVHQELMALSAAGGGDFPEHVNQALYDAVHKVKWSEDKKTLKIIFLVGDAPPHMDYTDDVKYPETCKKAVEKGIIINTVQCGHDVQCASAWKDIAGKANGEFVAIPQTGGVRVVTTPFDDHLAELLGDLMDTALIYGNVRQKQASQRMINLAKGLRGPAAADRAAFAAKSKAISPNDLLDAIRAKRVKLENVRFVELPAALQKLRTLDERREHLEKVAKRRAELQTEALDLERKRAEHITTAMGKGGKDGFDSQVLTILRKQAKKFDIEY
jgi:Mg-chelatase subunit ChlD